MLPEFNSDAFINSNGMENISIKAIEQADSLSLGLIAKRKKKQQSKGTLARAQCEPEIVFKCHCDRAEMQIIPRDRRALENANKQGNIKII
jgi:hypothetical protein